ncbi:MAG TPA: gamma carbonic anhydrase family protein [Dehalococcoidia bacterium]|jgi:carbonic anhydrase/acetyltransferase-like protein (isoleucine patch superfamily)|nr:gamma carbonic anhydrase family protein [Dehalococcoidia bacterium]
MLIPFRGKLPRIPPSSLVSSQAVLIGDIQVGENCFIWPGAVIRADLNPLRLGDNILIEDNAVLHGVTEIGDNVVIGHGAVVECSHIGSYVLIGDNATLTLRTSVGNYCIIGAGAVVPEGMNVPDNTLVLGVPARVKRRLDAQEVVQRIGEDFAAYAPLIAGYHKEDF